MKKQKTKNIVLLQLKWFTDGEKGRGKSKGQNVGKNRRSDPWSICLELTVSEILRSSLGGIRKRNLVEMVRFIIYLRPLRFP